MSSKMSKKKRGKRTGRAKPNGGGYRLPPGNRYTSVNRPRFTFIDPHMLVTLKYAETVQYSNATVVGSQNIFNLNSLFDPNRTGVGHQPYGYDQLSLLYNRYRVLKASWKVTFGPTTNQAVYGVVVPVNGLLVSAISNVTTFESACEVPFAWSCVVPNAGTDKSLSHRASMPLNVLGGVSRTEFLADDRFEATFGTSPAEVVTLYVGVYNPSGSTVANSVLVEIEYEVDMHDPIIAAPSFRQPSPRPEFKLVKMEIDKK